jgi:hypothetical protein
MATTLDRMEAIPGCLVWGKPVHYLWEAEAAAAAQFRVLQAVGASTGNTLILGLPAQSTAIPIKPGSTPAKEIPPEPQGEL